MPGLVPYSIADVDPDIFAGNCHKWMMAANGAGFLYVRGDLQDVLEPPVVSNGWLDVRSDQTNVGAFGNTKFVDRMGFPGTPDVLPLLSVRAACEFKQKMGWDALCAKAADTLEGWAQNTIAAFDFPALAPRGLRAPQMVALDLGRDYSTLQKRLFDTHQIEIPVIPFEGRHFIRASFQPYNTT